MHFSAEDLRSALTWSDLVDSQEQAFANLSVGAASLAPRGLLDYDGGTAFGYLARASAHGWPVVKIGSVNQGNPLLGLPTVHAYVFVLDRQTGELVATADGEAVTLLRTPAGTIAALEALGETQVLGTPMVIVGRGRQGRAHEQALSERYPGRRILVVSSREPTAIRAALRERATVILVSSSNTLVIDSEWVQPGSTIVSIGAFAPDRHEFGIGLVGRAGRVFADDAETAVRQCGPVASAIAGGVLDEVGVVSIGDVITQRWRASEDPGDVRLYVSVGLGIQDAAVMDVLMSRA